MVTTVLIKCLSSFKRCNSTDLKFIAAHTSRYLDVDIRTMNIGKERTRKMPDFIAMRHRHNIPIVRGHSDAKECGIMENEYVEALDALDQQIEGLELQIKAVRAKQREVMEEASLRLAPIAVDFIKANTATPKVESH